jgi:succinate dehydrogenase / fumarate reductase cytochrome b subunit
MDNQVKTRSHWFDLRLHPAGMLAYMLHRLTGIGLVVYLSLHLWILNQLRQGPQAWDGFLIFMRSPLVLLLDAILLFGILFHGLNGLRLTLLGWGVGLRWQRRLFWGSFWVALGLTAWGIWAMC